MKSKERSRKNHNVFHFRWSVPILSEIYDREGARFITLLYRLGISRSVLSSTLDKLISGGFIIRNPGYGHPLRPEYLLTEKGNRIAPFCQEIMNHVKGNKAERLVHSRWAFRILLLMSQKVIRFSELKSRLTPITPRALSEELKRLGTEGYISRKVIDDYPPTSLYKLTPKSDPFTAVFAKYKGLLEPFISSV